MPQNFRIFKLGILKKILFIWFASKSMAPLIVYLFTWGKFFLRHKNFQKLYNFLILLLAETQPDTSNISFF